MIGNTASRANGAMMMYGESASLEYAGCHHEQSALHPEYAVCIMGRVCFTRNMQSAITNCPPNNGCHPVFSET